MPLQPVLCRALPGQRRLPGCLGSAQKRREPLEQHRQRSGHSAELMERCSQLG